MQPWTLASPMLSFKGMLKQGWSSYRDARIKILAVKYQPGCSNISRQAWARFETEAIPVQPNLVPFRHWFSGASKKSHLWLLKHPVQKIVKQNKTMVYRNLKIHIFWARQGMVKLEKLAVMERKIIVWVLSAKFFHSTTFKCKMLGWYFRNFLLISVSVPM